MTRGRGCRCYLYYNATEAQLYLVLRDTAINLGYCTNDDLNLNEFIKHDGYYWEE